MCNFIKHFTYFVRHVRSSSHARLAWNMYIDWCEFKRFLYGVQSKTTVGSTLTEFSAPSASSQHFPWSQALLLLGIGTEAGSLYGSFEMSMSLFVQHTCRRIVPSIFVNVQAGGSNGCTLTTAWMIRCNWYSKSEKSGVSIFLGKSQPPWY